MEQIYEWDPDIIYITNFSPYQPEDLINNTIEGNDWSSVKAVKEGKVYKFRSECTAGSRRRPIPR